MATVDTSIYRFRVPKIVSPAEVEAQRLSMEGARQQIDMRNREMQLADENRAAAQQTSARRNALLQQYSGEELEQALRRSGFLDDAEKLETSRLNRDKVKAETSERRRATKDKEAERNVALLRNVRDQGTYTMLRNLIELKDGPEAVRSLPEEYNPQIIQAMINRYVPQQAIMDDQRARDLAAMTDARTRSEGAANRGNQMAIARMNDARQRESAQIQREAATATQATKPPSEGQAKAVLFGTRMAEADRVIADLNSRGVMTGNLIKQGLESIPLVGDALGMGANVFVGAEQQQVEQAQRDFINAVLRRESGAVIADSEFANARKQYFPQPGDSPQVVQQKARNRQIAIAGMKAEAGPHWTDTPAPQTSPRAPSNDDALINKYLR